MRNYVQKQRRGGQLKLTFPCNGVVAIIHQCVFDAIISSYLEISSFYYLRLSELMKLF